MAARKKENRGGKRAGAGRKQQDKRGPITPPKIGLRADQIKWLRRVAKRKGTNMSVLLRMYLDERIATDPRGLGG